MRKLTHGARGLTLIEVLVAVIIVAIISVISYQSLDVTVNSKQVVEAHLEKLARIDRTWMLLETDLKNVLAHTRRQTYGPGSGSDIPPMVIENGGDYWLTMLRGGHANPLDFKRTEVIRVGYRIQEETLWRDIWYDPSSTDVEQAQQQKIIDDVEDIQIRILPGSANSFSAGPWVEQWPQQAVNELPLALEVTLQLEGREEISRLYSLVKGV